MSIWHPSFLPDSTINYCPSKGLRYRKASICQLLLQWHTQGKVFCFAFIIVNVVKCLFQ